MTTDVVPGRVVIGVLDPGQWSACFGLSLADLYLFDAFGAQRIVRQDSVAFRTGLIRNLTGTGQVAVNRDKAVAAFLDKTNAEWLWFIDSDMGFEPDTVERLIKAADPIERPVMGGLCFTALNPKPPLDMEGRPTHRAGHAERYLIQPTVYLWQGEENDQGVLSVLDYPRDQIVKVSATGGACLLIHRDAAVKIRKRYGDEWFQPMTHPTAQGGKPRHFSEDISFCVRLAGVDLPLHVDTAIKITHEKGSIFLDEETFDDHMALLQLKAELRKAATG